MKTMPVSTRTIASATLAWRSGVVRKRDDIVNSMSEGFSMVRADIGVVLLSVITLIIAKKGRGRLLSTLSNDGQKLDQGLQLGLVQRLKSALLFLLGGIVDVI